jgi:hypothetical protein
MTVLKNVNEDVILICHSEVRLEASGLHVTPTFGGLFIRYVINYRTHTVRQKRCLRLVMKMHNRRGGFSSTVVEPSVTICRCV